MSSFALAQRVFSGGHNGPELLESFSKNTSKFLRLSGCQEKERGDMRAEGIDTGGNGPQGILGGQRIQRKIT
jgi:hypothetical protein